MTDPILELHSVSKAYGGLRPLRIERLVVTAGAQLALVGFDRPTAEVLINLATGASLPDHGEVALFGCASQLIQDSDEWLALADRFGIVSERAALLGGLSVVQNLAMPFSLDIEPPSAALRERAVALGREVGLVDEDWDRPLGGIDPAAELRVRLARALALDPAIVILEHATARLDSGDVIPLGRMIRGVMERRGTAALTLTADAEFAAAVAPRVLRLDPATGRLTEERQGWFHRLRR